MNGMIEISESKAKGYTIPEVIKIFKNATKSNDIVGVMPKSELSKCIIMLLEELAVYEDLDEKGLLKRLPVEIGADVYTIPSRKMFELHIKHGQENLNNVGHFKLHEVTFNYSEYYGLCVGYGDYCGFNVSIRDKSYGITWFLTREEAEQKLKEMEGD